MTCFFCDSVLTFDTAYITRYGKVYGSCCADLGAKVPQAEEGKE